MIPAGTLYHQKISFNSPFPYKDDAAFPIFDDGSSDKDYDVKTHNSYGMIYTTNDKFKFRSPHLDSGYDGACHVIPDGGISDGYSVVYWDSCGRSPGRTYDGSAYFADPDGSVGGYNRRHGVTDSYGIFISMIYYECDIDILYITITFYFLEVLKYET